MRPAIQRYGALEATSFCVFAGSLPNILVGIPALLSPETREAPAAAWWAALLSGTFAIGLSYFFWNYGIGRLGSARTALYSNFTPIVAMVTAWYFLGETLTLEQALGAMLAIVGVVLARRHTRPRD